MNELTVKEFAGVPAKIEKVTKRLEAVAPKHAIRA